MSTLHQRVGFLLQRYVDSTCTPDEFVELMALLRLDIDSPEIEQVLDRGLADAGMNPGEQQVDWEKMRLAILATQPPVVPVRRLFPIRRMVAAAVVAVLLGCAWWMLIRKSTPETIIAVQTQQDVLPGGNKALLTLSNGSVIPLDSAANGVLTQQGRSKVVKLSNGQLAYQPGGGKGKEILYNKVSTPSGGTYEVTLPDGTRVWLNALSTLRFPAAFPAGERRVEVSGEAYFEVSKNPAAPFRVAILAAPQGVRRGEVEVLGTTFNINDYSDEPVLTTTLISGSVRITAGVGQPPAGELSPGQQAIIREGSPIRIVQDTDIDKVTAWKDGKFIFDRDELPAIMRQLARWYDVAVEYRGTPSAAHFSGIISRSKNLSQVLNMLKATENIRFSIEDKKIIIMP